MGITVAEIRAKARRILQDTEAPYRWSDEELRDYLKDAVTQLHRLRPSTLYVDGLYTDGVEVPDDATVEFPIDARFREALAAYVASCAYERDATDTGNQNLVTVYRSKAESMMKL